MEDGPSDRIRTCGILLPKQARYQLRYTRLFSFLSGWAYFPKPGAIPTSLYPDIHFSAMIPRRTVKIKFFLYVVKHVVKAAFVLLSAIGENPANAGVARLCGVSPCHVPDTATALPNQARYQLRYTRILNDLMGMDPPEQRADAHCTRYPCIITHRRQKGKRILIRFSLPGKLSLDIIKNDNIFVK